MNFRQKLDLTTKENNSLLCVGLDPDMDKLPKHLLGLDEPIFQFNIEIIEATADLVCAFKPNIAFYEANGTSGIIELKKTIEYIHKKYSHIPVILDAKRADIANTARMYAKAAFEFIGADAVTVYPYLGLDATMPFLEYEDKCTILLLKTSNPDAGAFQDLVVAKTHKPFFLTMAEEIKTWDLPNIGLFVGATYPDELGGVRKIFPDRAILTAGIGKQGAKTEKAVKQGVDANGNNLICNNSRDIIYAASDKVFAEEARIKAEEIRDIINEAR